MFPFTESAEKLTKNSKAGPEFVELLRGLTPYRGGNIALRGLHDLDILDKHEMVLPTFHVTAFHSPNFQVGNLGFSMPGMGVPMSPRATIHVARETPYQITFQKDGGPYATFPDPLPFAGERIIVTLTNLSRLVSEIIEAFAGRLGMGDTNPPDTPG